MAGLLRYTMIGLLCLAGARAQAQSFVWRVEGAHNSVYLAGDMHLLPKRAYPLPDAYQQAYADADMLVVEADEDALNGEAARRQMLAAAHYDEGGLADHLDAETYARTRDLLAKYDLSIDRMNAFRPWFVAMTLEAQTYQAQRFLPEWGLDRYFHDLAIEDRKPTLPLQTITSHLAVFTQLPEKLSLDQLAVTLDNADELDDAPQQIYQYWREGNVDGFAKAVHEQAVAYPALYDHLIYERNTAWQQTLTALLHSPGNAMVLVGAAHLVGERGLVAVLRGQGYRVEPLP